MANSLDREMMLHPIQDERSRQAFIVQFKKKVNFELQGDIHDYFSKEIAPTLESDLGQPLDDLNRDHRVAVKKELYKEHIFQSWEALTWIGQDMMWNCIDETLDHDLPRLEALAVDVAVGVNKNKKGSLKLNPHLDLPSNIARVEIHRQPGGFCLERDGVDYDILSGARYTGGGMMYGAGKGRGHKAGLGHSAASFLIQALEEKFGPQKPKHILDIGCGTGLNTLTYPAYYPEAEVHGIDVAAGLLRWGHARAENEGVGIHFSQMSTAAMDFEDESFDMVVSTIWGHETTPQILRDSIAEIWRVLKPGGIAYHLDVTTQPGYQDLVDQVLNDWQIKNNGEPFWMGFADSDLKLIMTEKGYPKDCQFVGYQPRPMGAGDWFVHGVQKPT
ncbi:MAG: class I SAM-dependent methyltransferase [Rhodospirillaceae bacterium]